MLILIRHGEKVDNDEINLSDKGYKRADEIALYFSKQKNHNIKIPEIIIAMKQHDKNSSNRPYQTVHPLSKKLNLPIITDYTRDQIPELINLLNSYKDKTVLICWEHKYLAKIASTLLNKPLNWGFNPNSGKDSDVYDPIWIIENNILNIYKQFEP